MYFSNPWGLLALLAIPAIIVIHMYHRRFPPLQVAGLHLWTTETVQHLAGRKRERLPISASLLLELLAALLLALVLSRPHFGHGSDTVHLVAVLDNSASMLAAPPEAGGQSFRDAAIAELERRSKSLPRGSVFTLILSGNRPTMLAGPAVPWTDARERLAGWNPGDVRHSFEPAWDLGLQLVEKNGQLLFLTDDVPDDEESGNRLFPDQMECVSVGRRLENLAIDAARWSFDSASGRGTVFTRVVNLGRRPAKFDVRGRNGEQIVFRKSLTLADQGATSFEADVPGGLGMLAVEIVAEDDALAIDNRVQLVEPRVRTVTYAIDLPDGESKRLLRKVLDVLPDVQAGSVESATLLFAPGGILPETNASRWWLGIGPLSLEEDAVEQARDLTGPYLLDKRHPLLEGIVLGGVVWGGVQPVSFDVVPLISSGKSMLLSRLAGSRTIAYLLNIDFTRSNLGESPDWPIFLANLIEFRRDNQPGLQRWNYRLGEEVRFRLFEGDIDPAEGAGHELSLVHEGKAKSLARTALVELTAPEMPGVYEVKAGTETFGQFAVNFFDAEESDLRNLNPGHRLPRIPAKTSSIALDNPYSWIILLGLCLIVLTIFGDWFVLRSRSG